MNKRKLQEFATWAKLNLENQIVLSLKQIGINSEYNVKRSKVQGDVTIVEGIEKTFNRQFNSEREEIINIVRRDGYKHTIEQFASTWFNRIIAIRFLEIHEYLDHGFKIFPDEPNTLPEILSNLKFVKDDLNLDMEYIENISSDGNNKEELYRYVLFQQCNALATPLPMLFSKDMDYLKHFIPTPLLFGDTIINRLLEIDKEDFKDDVEIIGWLYQFYIAAKKDEVFASKEKITKDTLPAVTQLFTPEWIVKYMAENSIGRIWLESYPNSPLKDKMNYFIEEAKQEPEVEEKLKEIRYKNINPEDIKIIEPCSGSGHILVYCFDLLNEMYIEKGYLKKDVPKLILKNNLVGLDIDKRATQLASFALVMRARSIDNRFFEEDRYIRPKVYEIIDSKVLLHNLYDGQNYKQIIKDYNEHYWKDKLTNEELKIIDYVVELFENGKVIGSLLKVEPGKYLSLRKKLKDNDKITPKNNVFTAPFFENEFKELLEILRLAHFMSIKYDVMITNPPYVGLSILDEFAKKYLGTNYPNSKADMFAMFMETNYIKPKGYLSIINMHSWMFLKTYQKLRETLFKTKTLINMVHLGVGAFESINGEVVQTTAFILKNINIAYESMFFKLNNYEDKENEFLKIKSNSKKMIFYNNITNIFKIPGSILGYWCSENFIANFNVGQRIDDIAINTGSQNKTADNNKYLRYFWEVNKLYIGREKKWVLYAKGGEYRKHYGNINIVIKWDDTSRYFYKTNKTSNLLDEKLWYKEGITYTKITTKGANFRALPKDTIFDMGGPSIVCIKDGLSNYLLALLNSKVANYYFEILNPTINLQVNDLNQFPIIISKNKEIIDIIQKDNIYMSKFDWDSFETSMDFYRHPLLGKGKILDLFENYSHITKSNFLQLKENEEEINEYFIKLYGLEGELNKEVDEKLVSISIADKTRDIKSLISYLIGVLMGRYSLVKEGLIYAGGLFDQSQYGDYDVDKNGIIPIYSDINIEDSLVHRILNLVKQIYGEESYRENIAFIAEALGKKNNETNEETLNRYLNDDFYNDHLKIYQKRPIYWMFSSGKLSGFKALIYMHRYDENTLAKLNASYFQPATTILRNQISEIEKLIPITLESEKNQLNKKRMDLVAQLNEAVEYGQVLDYMANQYISIDLDDGVKVNYDKFQNIKFVTDRGSLTKNLLIPIK